MACWHRSWVRTTLRRKEKRMMNEEMRGNWRPRNGSWVISLSCALLILCCLMPAVAQETTAGIQGVVKDTTGAVIPGATVEASSSALMTPKKQQTDASGGYHFS